MLSYKPYNIFLIADIEPVLIKAQENRAEYIRPVSFQKQSLYISWL